jgi:hypothetical protein
MLQPLAVRPPFRVLSGLLGVTMIVGSIVSSIAVSGNGAYWGLVFVMLLPLPLSVFGGLLLVLAFTGCLPEWVVGHRSDNDS